MASPNFQRTLRSLSQQKLLIPILRAALADPDFESFKVNVRGWRASVREFDGWFHPSTHAQWTPRQLALYLRHGAEIPPEKPALEFVMAVTQGSFWHEFVQRVLAKRKVILRHPGTTARDSIEKQCEIALRDDELNVRGHADGQLILPGHEDELLEIKTMNDWKIQQFTSEDVLREKNPFGYWNQTQDYLMLSGRSKMRYLIMSMASPYPMQEFVVHADEAHHRRQRSKYRLALEMAQAGGLPEACCGIGSKTAKTCPVRDYCTIGRMTA